MTMHRDVRRIVSVVALTSGLASMTALADIYTWVDASGKLNLSNREPPDGARITNVYRESPEARASAEAARASAKSNELQALNQRVDQLERDLDAARQAPPPPIAYAPAIPSPAPLAYPTFVAQTIVVPSAPAYAAPFPAYGDCGDGLAGCFSPGYYGFYPGGVVVLNASKPRGPFRHERTRAPAMPQFPKPVGLLPDPPNLFPNPRRP